MMEKQLVDESACLVKYFTLTSEIITQISKTVSQIGKYSVMAKNKEER